MGEGGKVGRWIMVSVGFLLGACGRAERNGGSDATASVSDGSTGSGGTVSTRGQGLPTSAAVTGSAPSGSTTGSTTGALMDGSGGIGAGGNDTGGVTVTSDDGTVSGGTGGAIHAGSGGTGDAAGAAGAPGAGCDCEGPSLFVCGIDGQTYDAKCGKDCVPVEVACNRACPCSACACGGVFSTVCAGSENDYRCRTYQIDYAAAEAYGCRLHGDDLEYGEFSRPVGFCCPLPTVGLGEALCFEGSN